MATLVVDTGEQTLTNKTLTSPVLNTGISGTAFLDEDAMGTDSNTKVASQQSIKAYVDSGTVTMTNKTIVFDDNTVTTFKSSFRVTNNAQQTVTTGAARKVSFQTSVFDDNSDFDNTTNHRFVAPTTGTYFFSVVLSFSGLATRAIGAIGVNGTEVYKFFDDIGYSGGASTKTGSVSLKLNATDYVEVFCTSVGTNATIEDNDSIPGTQFMGYRIK